MTVLNTQARERLAAYSFLSPALLLFVVFLAGPMLAVIGLSFLHWDMLTTPEFAGFENYEHIFSDRDFLPALANTFVFSFWSVFLHITLGLLLAVGVNRAIPSGVKYAVRTLYVFPFLMSYASVALIWQYVLDPRFGLLNHYLRALNIPAPNWLVSPEWAMPAIIGVDLWRTLGYTFLILLTGLQTIPDVVYEAAAVDGANRWKRFWYITIPMLSPTLFFAVIITFIGAFQIFDPMFIMTQGGPGNSTLSMVQHLYRTAFQDFDMGYGSVISVVIVAVIVIVTAIQFRIGRRWVHYEA